MRKTYFKTIVYILCILFFLGCKQETEEKANQWKFEVNGLSDKDYPDNPNIGYRTEGHQSDYFKAGILKAKNNGDYKLSFYSNAGNQDTLTFPNLELTEFLPGVPEKIKHDPYLSKIALINQEWNRNQVRFSKKDFQFSGSDSIIRADIARNCLNSYAWEIILYKQKNGKVKPAQHGWFDFPHKKYRELVNQKSQIKFEDYENNLEKWQELESKFIDTTKLQDQILWEKQVKFSDLSDVMYPLKGARKKKRKDIVYPKQFSSMQELQSDSTLFATFKLPGFYSRAEPRKTELGRFYKLEKVIVSQTLHSNDSSKDSLHKIEMHFRDRQGNRQTQFVMGGLDFSEFPRLKAEEANRGWKNSMGFGNHSFYESKAKNTEWEANEKNYYAYLATENEHWLDSHKIGIDGPVFHWDAERKNLLHLWILSFERHAFIGHYTFDFN